MSDSLPVSAFCLSHGSLPAALRPFVREVYEAEPAPRRGVVTLSATTEATLHVRLRGEEGTSSSSAVVLTGPRVEAIPVVPDDGGLCLWVRFTAIGAYALFGVRNGLLSRAGGTGPLDAHVRPEIAETVRRFGAGLQRVADPGWTPAEAFAARAALTVAFLAHRVDDLTPGTVFLQSAVDEIERVQGHLSVRALAHTLCMSESTLRRRFGVLGMPVKRFAKIVQFRSTHAYRHANSGATWAEAALRFGYTDQAHLARDYRRLAGAPPTRWLPEARPAGPARRPETWPPERQGPDFALPVAERFLQDPAGGRA